MRNTCKMSENDHWVRNLEFLRENLLQGRRIQIYGVKSHIAYATCRKFGWLLEGQRSDEMCMLHLA